jgi:glucose-1-phosphatase
VISLVCFDLGGVLVRLSKSWSDAAARAGLYGHAGPSLDAEELRAARWQVVQAYQAGMISCSSYYAGLASLMNMFTPSELERVHAAWILEHYPGAEELIDALNGLEGVTTACLSNTNHAHWQQLTDPSGAYQGIVRLQVRLASHELGLNKPDPRIYERAAERLGKRGHEILFFDDLEENVVAARECGWHAEQIDPEADPPAQIRRHLARHGVPLPLHSS